MRSRQASEKRRVAFGAPAALRRFKRQVQQEGIIKEVKRHSTFKIVYSVRIYQRVGPSHEQWREMTPPDLQSTTSLEAKARCTDGAVTPSPESKTRAEQSIGDHGKL